MAEEEVLNTNDLAFPLALKCAGQTIPNPSTDESRARYRESRTIPIGISFSIRNTGGSTVEVSWAAFRLRDKNGVEYEPTVFASHRMSYFTQSTLVTGDDTGGWVFFEIPNGTDLGTLKLRYKTKDIQSNIATVPPTRSAQQVPGRTPTQPSVSPARTQADSLPSTISFTKTEPATTELPSPHTPSSYIAGKVFGEAVAACTPKELKMRIFDLESKPVKLIFNRRSEIDQVKEGEYRVELRDDDYESVTMFFSTDALNYVKGIKESYRGDEPKKKYAIYGIPVGRKQIESFDGDYWSWNFLFIPLGRTASRGGGRVSPAYSW